MDDTMYSCILAHFKFGVHDKFFLHFLLDTMYCLTESEE